MDDDEADDTEAEALAYLRGVCSICNTQVAGSSVMCGLRDCCYDCDYNLSASRTRAESVSESSSRRILWRRVASGMRSASCAPRILNVVGESPSVLKSSGMIEHCINAHGQ